MDEAVRYRTGDALGNAILRLALLEAWGYRCYLCRAPKEFADFQIDHIIAHTTAPNELEKLLAYHVVPEARERFDLHAACNLAPVCVPCNTEKNDHNFAGTDRVSVVLRKAHKRRDRVEKHVRSFRSSNAVTKAMLAVTTADLSDPRSLQALIDFGPLVVQRLGKISPALVQYPINYEFWDPHADDPCRVIANLDATGRRAQVILEDVFGADLEEVLLKAITSLKRPINVRLQEDIAVQLDRQRYQVLDVGHPAGRLFVEVDRLLFARPDAFTVHGTFDIDVSASVLVDSNNDSGTDHLQGDAAAHGEFSVVFRLDRTGSTSVEVDDVDIDEWRKGAAPW